MQNHWSDFNVYDTIFLQGVNACFQFLFLFFYFCVCRMLEESSTPISLAVNLAGIPCCVLISDYPDFLQSLNFGGQEEKVCR